MIKLLESEFSIVLPLLEEVPFNKLFAQVIISRVVRGTVFVDDPLKPTVSLIVHKYGMALLCGNISKISETFLRETGAKWLISYPSQLQVALPKSIRVNFKFQRKEHPFNLPSDFHLVKIDEHLYERINGSVVPKAFWNTGPDFISKGVGYTLLEGDEIVSTCFTSFIVDNKYELGVETTEKYRGKGYALFPCMALIQDCLSQGFEPIWACRKDNIGSYKLAEKLGFIPLSYHQYYFIE